MKKIKNFIIVALVCAFTFVLSSCIQLDENTTLQFSELPKETYVVGFEEQEFLDSVKVKVNGNEEYTLSELKEAGAVVSTVSFDNEGKKTIVISYQGATLSYDFYVKNESLYVAQIGSDTYESLIEAFAAAPANGTETEITILSDKIYRNIEGDYITVKKGQNIVLDLNGHTLKAYLVNQKSTTFIGVNGTLTIQDSSEDKNGALRAEGMYNSDPYYVSAAVIKNYDGGKLVINSGSVINDCGNASWSYAIDTYQNSLTEINGGRVESKKYRAIRLFANSGTVYTTLNIHGGEIVSLTNNAIWFQAPTTGVSALVKCVIDGGRIESNGTYNGEPRYSININGPGNNDKFDVKIYPDAKLNHTENLPESYFVTE